jgi:hypothetical protein
MTAVGLKGVLPPTQFSIFQKIRTIVFCVFAFFPHHTMTPFTRHRVCPLTRCYLGAFLVGCACDNGRLPLEQQIPKGVSGYFLVWKVTLLDRMLLSLSVAHTNRRGRHNCCLLAQSYRCCQERPSEFYWLIWPGRRTHNRRLLSHKIWAGPPAPAAAGHGPQSEAHR